MTQNETPRGLRAEVVTGEFHSPNGGVSARVKHVTIVGEGFEPVFAATDDAPAVKMVTRHYGGQTLIHFEPVESPDPGSVGWMASGAYLASSDSRFSRAVGIYAAIPFHDRQETQAQYNALSI